MDLRLLKRSETDTSSFDPRFSSAAKALRSSPYRESAVSAPITAQLLRVPCQSEFWIVLDGNTVLGRIGANRSFANPKLGYVGFFEMALGFEHSPRIASALLNAACDWLKQSGVEEILGPVDLSTWFTYRFIEKDFPDRYSWEPSNSPEYVSYFTRNGFERGQAYISEASDHADKIRAALEPYTKNCSAYTFRSFDLERFFEAELPLLYELTLQSFKGQFLFDPIAFELFREIYVPLREKMSSMQYSKLALDEKGKPCAFLFCFMEKGDLVYKTIGTLPSAQGKGIAYALMHQALEHAKEQKPKGVVCALVKEDAISERFIKKFSEIGGRRWRHEYFLYRKRVPK